MTCTNRDSSPRDLYIRILVTARERFIGTPPKQSSKIQTKSETVAKVRDQTTLSGSSLKQNAKIS